MMIQCPGCAARYRLKEGGFDKPSSRVRCPKCSRVFEVSSAIEKETPIPRPVVSNALLVVDDARFFRELIVDVLKPLNRVVFTAPDGETALAMFRQERPALVILDLNLPKMTGYELIRAIRAEAGGGEVKLLAMSGVFRTDEDAHAVQVAGADFFTSKSFKPEQFLKHVRELLGERT